MQARLSVEIIRHTETKGISNISIFRNFKYVCSESEKKNTMLQKLFLAVTMTLALNLFLGVRLAANSQTTTSSYKLVLSWQYLGVDKQGNRSEIAAI